MMDRKPTAALARIAKALLARLLDVPVMVLTKPNG